MAIETGDDLRQWLRAHDLGVTEMARLMRALGDVREPQPIWRALQRMVAGDVKIAPEVHMAIRSVEAMAPRQVQDIATDPRWGTESTQPEVKVRRWDFGILKVIFVDERG